MPAESQEGQGRRRRGSRWSGGWLGENEIPEADNGPRHGPTLDMVAHAETENLITLSGRFDPVPIFSIRVAL